VLAAIAILFFIMSLHPSAKCSASSACVDSTTLGRLCSSSADCAAGEFCGGMVFWLKKCAKA